jgi:hypothetical protein
LIVFVEGSNRGRSVFGLEGVLDFV